jgi:hypothetical protein
VVVESIAHIEAPQFGRLNHRRATYLNAPSARRTQLQVRFRGEAEMNWQARRRYFNEMDVFFCPTNFRAPPSSAAFVRLTIFELHRTGWEPHTTKFGPGKYLMMFEERAVLSRISGINEDVMF